MVAKIIRPPLNNNIQMMYILMIMMTIHILMPWMMKMNNKQVLLRKRMSNITNLLLIFQRSILRNSSIKIKMRTKMMKIIIKKKDLKEMIKKKSSIITTTFENYA